MQTSLADKQPGPRNGPGSVFPERGCPRSSAMYVICWEKDVFEAIGLILFGLCVGCYGTLVGIGGGPLIVPMVATFYTYSTIELIGVSTFVVFCNTLSGTLAYWRERRIDMVSATKFGLAAIPGALITVAVMYHIHLNLFSFIFGFFLLLLALYILLHPRDNEGAATARPFWKNKADLGKAAASSRLSHIDEVILDRPQESNHAHRVIVDRSGHRFEYTVNEALGVGVTAVIGVLSSFLGIGGGLIQMPALVYILSFPVHVATATSHFITAINAGFTLIPIMSHGSMPYKTALCMGLGSVIGAQFGAKLSNRIDGKKLLFLLVPVFLLLAVKLMFFTFQ